MQQRHYKKASVADIAAALKAQKMFSSRAWKRLYSDGTVVKWMQQVSDFFMAEAGAAKGWNYTVRLYRPRPEILSGQWKFPEPQAVN